MAKLKNCGDCGQQVSKSAKRCPHCGKRFTSRLTWIFGGFFAFIVFFTVFGVSNNDTSSTAQPNTTSANNPQKEQHIAQIEADPNYKSVKTMPYATCLDLQKVYGESMKGAKSIPIKNEKQLSVVKYCANDGAVTVTCDGKKDELIIAKDDNAGC